MIKVLLKYFYIESNETHSPTKPTQVARLHAQTWCQPAEEEGGGGVRRHVRDTSEQHECENRKRRGDAIEKEGSTRGLIAHVRPEVDVQPHQRTLERSVFLSQARPKKNVIFLPLVCWVVVVVACGRHDGNASIEMSPSSLV